MESTIFLVFLFSLSFMLARSEFYYDRFPDDFMWGIATSAYQVEGAWNESGKSEHIWDRFAHDGRVYNNDTGDIAGDSYHHLEEDVQLVKRLNVDYYRFSLSWSRIIPNPKNRQRNQAGIDYYNRLINELLKNNIQPLVTIYHWDLPQILQDEFGGWNDSEIVEYFHEYADVVFNNFGDRVKYWLTFNEPWVICWMGYGSAEYAPAIKEPYFTPYQCGHNILLSHAKVYELYQNKYKKKQKGQIGITLNTDYFQPKDANNKTHHEAAERAQQFNLGWFANPVFGSGDYPTAMKEYIKQKSIREGIGRSRLPVFTEDQKQSLKGSADFLGLNHYTTSLAEPLVSKRPGYPDDLNIKLTHDRKWQRAGSAWLYIVPWGFRKVLKWIKNEYNNVKVMVTENGVTDNNGTLQDQFRINFYKNYINEMLKAVKKDQCNVVAYTAWCLLDTFEWSSGYHEKFGLYHVNFTDPQRKRSPKLSANYYAKLVKDNGFLNDNSNNGSSMSFNNVLLMTFVVLYFIFI